MEQTNIEDRAKYLHSFCNKIAELPYLHYSGIFSIMKAKVFLDVYQLFLRSRIVDLDQVIPYKGVKN